MLDILLIHKTGFTTGEFRGVKSVAFDSATQLYTITKSDSSTVQYSAVSYYIQFLWG